MIIEKIILNHLNSVMAIPYYMEEPINKPDEYGLIEKTGSTEITKLACSSTFAIQTYAQSLEDAAERNQEMIEAMDSLINHDEVCHCELNSDYNFTDTTTKRYRYQAVFDVVHYRGGN